LPPTGGWLACGNGLVSYRSLRERISPFVDIWKPEIMPSAEAVIQLAAPRFAHGERIDPADAIPFYVRNKVAKTVAERLAIGGKA
jgi:tRNA threonylcarbamoyladenosine biosynthesis protein TsaB